MTYINHVTLATGHTSRIKSGDVAGETLARAGPWLAVLVESGQPAPLPVSALAAYDGQATVEDGGLIVTISGPPVAAGPMAGSRPTLVTMGIANRSRHAEYVWSAMTGPGMPPIKPGVARPDAPWVAVAIWPTIQMHPDALEWLGDLERCVAWAWLQKDDT